MKAVLFHTFGDAGVLQLEDAPVPTVRPHDLLVRVHAAGVNRADLTHHRGGYFGDSTIRALEIAGEVIEVDPEAQGYQVRIDWRMAMPIPEGLDDVHAAAIPEVFVTAHEAALHLGRLKQGDALLVHAAAAHRRWSHPPMTDGKD